MGREEFKNYVIVDGERRWRAKKLLMEQQQNEVDSDTNYLNSIIYAIYVDKDSQLVGILGNIVRNSYNSMETADAYKRLKKLLGKDGKDATNKTVGDRVGKAPNTVSEYLSLLDDLPVEVQNQARLDSRVPYNKLKTLAASGLDNDEKKNEYHRLYTIHSAKNVGQGDSNIESKPSKDDKRVTLIHTKIKAVNSALEMQAFRNMIKKGMADEVKADLRNALGRTIGIARDLIKELELQQPAPATVVPEDGDS